MDEKEEGKEQDYKEMMISRMEKYGMIPEEYKIFVLQGIKKELITIREILKEIIKERKWKTK